MNRGIVLQAHRTHPARLVVFDELQGKVVAYQRSHDAPLRASYGSLLTYNYSLWRNVMFLELVELSQLPHVVHDDNGAGSSFHFIHQVLELLEAFVPHALPLPELFEKIFLLYTDQLATITASTFRQQVFLCKILASLGVYPEEAAYLSNHAVRCLILSPFEFMVDHEDARIHTDLTLWLKGCLATHPTVVSWKTLK